VALALYNVIRQVNEMNKRNSFNKKSKNNSCKRCDVLVVEMMLRLYAVTAKYKMNIKITNRFVIIYTCRLAYVLHRIVFIY
jgi:hypothetical protein